MLLVHSFFSSSSLTSISGESFMPRVFRYSEFLTEGTALAVQYWVGQNMNLGAFRCWKKRGVGLLVRSPHSFTWILN